jgi:hypothetical protein
MGFLCSYGDHMGVGGRSSKPINIEIGVGTGVGYHNIGAGEERSFPLQKSFSLTVINRILLSLIYHFIPTGNEWIKDKFEPLFVSIASG